MAQEIMKPQHTFLSEHSSSELNAIVGSSSISIDCKIWQSNFSGYKVSWVEASWLQHMVASSTKLHRLLSKLRETWRSKLT
eukprot:4453850-Prorocentrum_lima.AAC.1